MKTILSNYQWIWLNVWLNGKQTKPYCKPNGWNGKKDYTTHKKQLLYEWKRRNWDIQLLLLGKVYLGVNFALYFIFFTLHNMLLFKIIFLVIWLWLLLFYNSADHRNLHKKAKNNLAMVLYSWIILLFFTIIL